MDVGKVVDGVEGHAGGGAELLEAFLEKVAGVVGLDSHIDNDAEGD